MPLGRGVERGVVAVFRDTLAGNTTLKWVGNHQGVCS